MDKTLFRNDFDKLLDMFFLPLLNFSPSLVERSKLAVLLHRFARRTAFGSLFDLDLRLHNLILKFTG